MSPEQLKAWVVSLARAFSACVSSLHGVADADEAQDSITAVKLYSFFCSELVKRLPEGSSKGSSKRAPGGAKSNAHWDALLETVSKAMGLDLTQLLHQQSDIHAIANCSFNVVRCRVVNTHMSVLLMWCSFVYQVSQQDRCIIVRLACTL